MSETVRPTRLSNRNNRVLEITWDNGRVTSATYHDLRASCPCAECVNELTGERVLRIEDIAEDVHPQSIAFVGQYAMRFNWSDGHNTGIYTFARLREMTGESRDER